MKGWTVVTPLFFVYIPRRCKNWVFYRKLGGRPALSKTSQAFLKENHCESQIEINSQAGSSLKGTLSDKIFRRMENSFHFNKKNFKFSWSQIRYLLKYNHSNEIDTVFLFLYWISSFFPLLRQLYCWLLILPTIAKCLVQSQRGLLF